MKKIFSLMLIAVAAVALFACKPDNGGNNEPAKKTYRLVKYVDAYTGTFDYKYDKDGLLSSIERVEIDGDNTWISTYTFELETSTKTLKILENGEVKWTAKVNDDGLITEFDGKTITYQGKRIVKVERDGGILSEVFWDEKGNITKWNEHDGETIYEKLHTYGNDKNVANIRNIFAEKCGVPRWLAEAGFIGDGTAYLCTGNGWGDASLSRYEYEANEDNYVTKETKIGGSGEDEYSEVGLYTWEEVK